MDGHSSRKGIPGVLDKAWAGGTIAYELGTQDEDCAITLPNA
ncbi:MAG: hypothetical protein RLY86_1041 [Pseudomonadota bacterium]|jgi:hypothetical protein